MVLTKFAGPTDPRLLATIEHVLKELTSDSLVHRYHPQQAADDGFSSVEGTFTARSFWMAESLASAGRLDEARLMLEKTLSYSNHVGLYAGFSSHALTPYNQCPRHSLGRRRPSSSDRTHAAPRVWPGRRG
jgi:hypothetical protein